MTTPVAGVVQTLPVQLRREAMTDPLSAPLLRTAADRIEELEHQAAALMARFANLEKLLSSEVEQGRFSFERAEEAERRLSDGVSWRPVSELPEKTGHYLGWIQWEGYKGSCSLIYYVAPGSLPEHFGADGFHARHITHWMPLPEAP